MSNFQKLRVIRIGCLQPPDGNCREMVLKFQDRKKYLNNGGIDTEFGPGKYPAVLIDDSIIPNNPNPSGQQGVDDSPRRSMRREKS